MIKSLAMCSCLLLYAALAWAQPARNLPEKPAEDTQTPETQVDTPQRRSALRAALESQRVVSAQPEKTPSTEHQLNAQERAVLRQQLRQQGR